MTLAESRYVSLVQQLADERSRRYGWKSEVARLLDVHPSYVSRIDSGEHTTIGKDAIARACKNLGLAASYFTAHGAVVRYRDFLAAFDGGQRPVVRARIPPEQQARAIAWLKTRAITLGTMRAVAREIGFSEESLSRVTNGRRAIGDRLLRAIERVQGVDPALDPELDAMKAIVALDDGTRARVLEWARLRWP